MTVALDNPTQARYGAQVELRLAQEELDRARVRFANAQKQMRQIEAVIALGDGPAAIGERE